ncbi:MAG: PTS sugar transporter subunit IIA [Humidesulfovibrio sp.]|uniref:PTS sugar transporter subunit IIA n=1 Tax=Humidesulfovibrio sp. TaxID=2910988 RepID=UPI0027342359|nr:PTS sugar transporter subunit IIA [Humidesulfovibrio sp.]MDP2848006.1 PTS sugar transporter subunit IIA [Humidesulfovibrio sp.]
MRLDEYLDPGLVLPTLKSTTKSEVLREMTGAIAVRHPHLDADLALSVLLDREGLGTTGIGDGVAIPHGKLPALSSIIVLVGRSLHGVDFESLDFKPCNIFFLVLAPEQMTGIHLRILAHISRLIKDDSFRKDFFEAADSDALYRLLQSY